MNNDQECVFCFGPTVIHDINNGRITYECQVCEGEFSIIAYREMTAEEREIHLKFVNKLFEEIKDLDPEICKVINENFWKLI
jgi:hypothetical protein